MPYSHTPWIHHAALGLTSSRPESIHAMRSKNHTLILLLFFVIAQLTAMAQSSTPLRRPISPNQPTWFVHIDTWNFADPQKIIDLIPADIRPYIIFNISMSQGQDADGWGQVDSGYETAKSWLRTCAQNKVWTIIQPASGGYCHFSDYDLAVYEDFFRSYPNFLGFNYCEQFWGFNDSAATNPSPPWQHRVAHWARLLPLTARYGGYLTVSWCGNTYGPPINPIGMLKRNPDFLAACEQYAENFILCEKYTQGAYQSDMESLCLGAYLSGYSGNYGIRYDSTGWTDSTKTPANFTMASAGAPHLEHAMLTGQTVIDAPELIWAQDFYEGSVVIGSDGYRSRQWFKYPQFDNMSIDLFRKILDGTVRIPTRQEVIDRTKIVVINNVNTGSSDDIYSSPTTLFEGLYRMDGDGNLGNNMTFFKKTGRYPTMPTVYNLADTPAQSFQIKLNKSAYSSRWPTIAAKQAELNSLFPAEYTGDIFAGRHENGWVVYNPYKTTNVNGPDASGSIPFKYNTCDHMELTLSQYASGVIKETTSSLSFYLNNHDNSLGLAMRTQTIRIFGSTTEPTWSYTDRASHDASTVSGNWADGVFTLTVTHNGPLDISVNCAGTATGRFTSYTPATLIAPDLPMTYTGPRQYEGEHFDYKNISGNVVNGDFASPPPVTGYTGQGYLKFGTSSSASVRDTVTVLKSGNYRLETRYSVTGGNVNTLDLYVNGTKVADLSFTQTATYNDWAVNSRNITLNAGANTIEYRAGATAPYSIYFDNLVVVPTAYGDGLVIQENQSGFADVDGTISSANSGYTGTGFADTNDATGAGINWVLNSDSSTVKSFTFRYASTVAGSANLLVDGFTVVSNIPFPSTGSLSSWEYATVYAYVPTATTKVRLEAISSSGLPNVDSLEVAGGSVWVAGNPPFMPVGLSGTEVSPSRIDLSWAIAPGADSYVVKRSATSGGPYTTIATGVTNTSYSDTGRSELTTYYYVISASNGNGASVNSAETSATTKSSVPPVAPTGLAAAASSFDRVNLTWTATPGADTYIVKRSRSNGGPYTTVAIGMTGTSFADTDLFSATTYYYVVSAMNEMGESPNSAQSSSTTPNTASFEPIADTMVNDGAAANYIHGSDLELKVKNDGLTNTGYNRSTFLKFDVNGLADAQTVTLKLTPYQVDGNATLNYELVTDDGWIETGGGGMTWNNQPAGSGTVIASLSGYTVGQQKSIDVTTHAKGEAAGDGLLSLKVSEPSPSAILVGFHPREALVSGLRPMLVCALPYVSHPVPSAPTDLAAVAISPTRTDLTWTASPGASRYIVKRASDVNGPYTPVAAGFSGLTYSDTRVVEGNIYYYKVSAFNGSGESPDSEIASTSLLGFGTLENHATGTFLAIPGGTTAGTFDLVDDTNVLVVGVYADTSGVIFPTTNTTFGGATPDGVIQTAGSNRMTAFYWLNPNTASGKTLVIDCNTTKQSGYFALEVSGVDTSAPVAATGATTTDGRSTSITTTNGNSFIVSFYSANGGGLTLTPQSPLIQAGSTLDNINGVAGGGSMAAATMTLAAAGPHNLVWTQNGTAGQEGVNGFAFVPSPTGLVPSAPDDLTATSVSASRIDLSWTASPEAVSYNVKRSTTPGGSYANIATGVTATSYDDTGLSEGTPYYYVVTAVNPNGESEDSAEANSTPQKLPALVTLDNPTVTYDGSPKMVAATTTPTGLPLEITYNGSPTPPTRPGTYAVSAVVNNAEYQGSATGSLVIAPRSFTAWESDSFSAQQILDGKSAALADPDGDGLKNLAEYALGTDPLSFTPQPTVSNTPTELSITFLRPAHIGDVSYFAETSEAMQSWDSLVLEVLNPGSDPETVKATKIVTEPSPDRLFIRLRFVR